MTSLQPTPIRMHRILDALCVECGTVRQCQRPRNRVLRDDVTWERDLGDLKCDTCGRITRHAIVRWGGNHDEMLDAWCRGRQQWPDHFTEAEIERCTRAYRKAQPQNPDLDHMFWISDAKAAAERGDGRVRTLCGAFMALPERYKNDPNYEGNPSPMVQRSAHVEHDDLSRFLTQWSDTECVDCQFAHNRWVVGRQRKRLKVLMTAALGELLDQSCVGDYDEHLPELIAALERVHGEGGGPQ